MSFNNSYVIKALVLSCNNIFFLFVKETPKTILYMYGAFGVVAVNAITLATELMLKSRK